MGQISKSAARMRIDRLLDAGSFVEIGAYVTARYNTAKDLNDGDGVVTGYGTIDGALVYVYAQEPTVYGGSLGEMGSGKISRIFGMAMDMEAPVIALVDCAGVRLNEGNDSLYSFGCLFRNQAELSGLVPQITAVFGTCGGGMAVSAAMSDFVFIEKNNGKLFVTSPNAIKDNYEEKCNTSAAGYQSEYSGLADFTGTEEEIYEGIRDLIRMLPQNYADDYSFTDCSDDLNRSVEGIDTVSDRAQQIRMIADDGEFLEVKACHARSVMTGFIRINGRTTGVVANVSGELCHKGLMKAAEFIGFCDDFGIQLLTLTDAREFKRTEENERNIARAAGKLVWAYTRAEVPKATVILGCAYGTPGIIMNSASIGSDIVYAWTDSQMGLMDKSVLKDITDAVDKDVNSALYNARRGYIDDIIDPSETRQRLAASYEMLYSKR